MANYTFRLTATGVAELKRDLEALGPPGAQAFQRIEGAARQLGDASERAAGGVRGVGQVVQQAGFQIQDFAVQVQSGTSALVALAQQGPQFLGIFGPAGAIAGAGLAIGAVVAQMVLLGDRTETAGENAKQLADELKRSLDVLTGMETVSAGVAKNLSASVAARIAETDRTAAELRARRPTADQFVLSTRTDPDTGETRQIIDRARLARAQAEFDRANRAALIEADILRANAGLFDGGETARTRQGDELAREVANRDAKSRLERERAEAKAADERIERERREQAERERRLSEEITKEVDLRTEADRRLDEQRQKLEQQAAERAQRERERDLELAARAEDFPAAVTADPAFATLFEEAIR
jgi:hypothetical protein